MSFQAVLASSVVILDLICRKRLRSPAISSCFSLAALSQDEALLRGLVSQPSSAVI